MKSFTIKLINKKEEAAGTMFFHFEKQKKFSYKPGQYALFSLIDPPHTDIKGNTRAISIASAPSKNDIAITMRMSDSAFKRSLIEMKRGTEVEMQGSLGHLYIEENETRQVVFLAGGIGIVPFRSMLAEMNMHEDVVHDTTLIYSNRIPEETTYYDELSSYAGKNIHIIFTASGIKNENKSWKHERRRIDQKMIETYVKTPQRCVYYIVGVPQMVRSMQDILEEMGVSSHNVKIELFGGY